MGVAVWDTDTIWLTPRSRSFGANGVLFFEGKALKRRVKVEIQVPPLRRRSGGSGRDDKIKKVYRQD